MSMVLNEEQIATQDAAKKLIQTESPVSALRKLRDENNELGIDQSLWQQMIEMGWPGIMIPEEFGGLGLSASYMSVILEEMGKTLTASPLWSSGLFAAHLLTQCSNDQIKQTLLPKIASGEAIVSVAIDEKSRHAPFIIDTQLTEQNGTYMLSGQKNFVVNGHIANQLIVSAKDTKGQLHLVLLDANQNGVTVDRNWMVDYHNSASLQLNNVVINQDQLLFAGEEASAALEFSLDVARLGLCAEMLGTAQEAFDRTLVYLKERTQFDAVIGSFQALKHRAADLFCELELSRSAVREGFSALEESDINHQTIAKLASIAKAQLSLTLIQATNEAVQMHGGIGMTDEHEIGFFMKRARVLEQLLGDDVYHCDRYASLNRF